MVTKLLNLILLFTTITQIQAVPTSNVSPATNATTLDTAYSYEEPWCIWSLNGVWTYSFAVLIPHDGTKETDSVDKANHCGERLRKKASLKGVAITDVYVCVSKLWIE